MIFNNSEANNKDLSGIFASDDQGFNEDNQLSHCFEGGYYLHLRLI